MELIAFGPVPRVFMFLLRMISLMNVNNWKHAHTVILWYSSRFQDPWECRRWVGRTKCTRLHSRLFFVYALADARALGVPAWFIVFCVCVETRGCFHWKGAMRGEKGAVLSKWESSMNVANAVWVESTVQVGGGGNSRTRPERCLEIKFLLITYMVTAIPASLSLYSTA